MRSCQPVTARVRLSQPRESSLSACPGMTADALPERGGQAHRTREMRRKQHRGCSELYQGGTSSTREKIMLALARPRDAEWRSISTKNKAHSSVISAST